MSNEHERKRNFVCPYCRAKQELPPTRPNKVQCANCDMMVNLGEGKSRRSKKVTSEPSFTEQEPALKEVKLPHQQPQTEPVECQVEEVSNEPAEELFPEQRPVDLDTAPLLEDRAARGRHSRKRKVGFIGRVKTVDEEEKVRWKRKKVQPIERKDNATEDDWDAEHSDVENKDQQPRSRMVPVIAVGGLVIAVLLVAAVSLSGLNRKEDKIPGTTVASQDVVPIDYVAVRQAIEGFLKAQSVDQLIDYIRDPDRVVPLARQYYTDNALEPLVYKPIQDLEGLVFDGRYLEVVVDLIGVENRSVVVEQVGTEYRVDWESWVGYSETSWDDFVAQRMKEPRLFRVMIGPDNYYNHKFKDPLDYGCYRLEDQLGNHRLYAYVPRESRLAKHLEVAFRKARFGVAMVKIQFPDDNPRDSLGNQVVISEFVGFGWAARSD